MSGQLATAAQDFLAVLGKKLDRGVDATQPFRRSYVLRPAPDLSALAQAAEWLNRQLPNFRCNASLDGRDVVFAALWQGGE